MIRRVRAEVIGFARMLAEQHRLAERLAGQTVAVRASRDRLRRSEDRAAEYARDGHRRPGHGGYPGTAPAAEQHARTRTRCVALVDDILAQLTMSAESLHPTSVDQRIAEALPALAALSPIPVTWNWSTSTCRPPWLGQWRLWRRKR